MRPFEPLPEVTEQEQKQCRIGTTLFLVTLDLLLSIGERGGWVCLEHPRDRGAEPFPSFFNSDEVRDVMDFLDLEFAYLDQCRYGGDSRKPTQLMITQFETQNLGLLCNHRRHRKVLKGLARTGGFVSGPSARYPRGLAHALATTAVLAAARALLHCSRRPFRPPRGARPLPRGRFPFDAPRCCDPGSLQCGAHRIPQ